jgi:hypothetical protein
MNCTADFRNFQMLTGLKSHYIPIFYLKQWVGPDGRLCEYSRPFKEVKAHRRYPSQTAFERGLHTLTTYPPHIAEIVERKLMRATDDFAARAFIYCVTTMWRRLTIQCGLAGGAL